VVDATGRCAVRPTSIVSSGFKPVSRVVERWSGDRDCDGFGDNSRRLRKEVKTETL